MIVRETPVVRSPRVVQLEGLFDLSPAERSRREWSLDLPLSERAWQIGLIVGPSGSGKSTCARALFGENAQTRCDWPADRAIVDAFPQATSMRSIAGLLSSVGFSSPHAWLRPYRALSTGEQFRADLAMALSSETGMVVVDEFTSVVDRTVARIGSAAVAKAVRRKKADFQFVAVSCHEDIVDWLDPDWVFEPAVGDFHWRRERRGRPPIELEIIRTDAAIWRLFKPHHYLSGDLHPRAKCFLALFEGRPAAFTAAIHFPHPRRSGWREHRTVCLPDFQGVGIGNALSEFVASLFRATGKPFRSTTSHPAMIAHRARSPLWRMIRPPSLSGRGFRRLEHAGAHSDPFHSRRITASFEYMGPARREEAARFRVQR